MNPPPRRPAWGLAPLLISILGTVACSGEENDHASRVGELERRVEALESELSRQRDFAAELQAALRAEDILVYPEPPLDEEEALDRQFDALAAAMNQLEAAVTAKDATRGERALETLQRAVGKLASRREQALPRLLDLAKSARSPEQRMRYLDAYAELAGDEEFPELERLLLDPAADSPLRAQAGRILITRDRIRAFPLIARVLGQEEGGQPFHDLYFLVYLMGESRDPAAIPILVEALKSSPDRSVRCHAATALGNFAGEPAVSALGGAALHDEFPPARVNAIRALLHAATRREHVVSVAEVVLRQDPEASVRSAAQEVLGKATTAPLPGPIVPPPAPGR